MDKRDGRTNMGQGDKGKRVTTTSDHPQWKDDDLGYLSMDFKSFYIQPTPSQGEVNDSDGQVKHRGDLDELLGILIVPYVWISTCPLSKGNPRFHQQEVPTCPE
jgi:hypothetical protein